MNVIKLLKPKSIVAFLYEDCSVRQGLEKMRAHGYTSIPVISRDGIYKGSVTEGDFLWYIMDNKIVDLRLLEDINLLSIMRKEFNPPVKIDIKVDELVISALNQNYIPVIDDRNLFIGIITRRDIIEHFAKKVTSVSV